MLLSKKDKEQEKPKTEKIPEKPHPKIEKENIVYVTDQYRPEPAFYEPPYESSDSYDSEFDSEDDDDQVYRAAYQDYYEEHVKQEKPVIQSSFEKHGDVEPEEPVRQSSFETYDDGEPDKPVRRRSFEKHDDHEPDKPVRKRSFEKYSNIEEYFRKDKKDDSEEPDHPLSFKELMNKFGKTVFKSGKKLEKPAKTSPQDTYQALSQNENYEEPEFYNPAPLYDPTNLEGEDLGKAYQITAEDKEEDHKSYTDWKQRQDDSTDVNILESFKTAAKMKQKRRHKDISYQAVSKEYKEPEYYNPETIFDTSSSTIDEERLGKAYMSKIGEEGSEYSSYSDWKEGSAHRAPLPKSFTQAASEKRTLKRKPMTYQPLSEEDEYFEPSYYYFTEFSDTTSFGIGGETGGASGGGKSGGEPSGGDSYFRNVEASGEYSHQVDYMTQRGETPSDIPLLDSFNQASSKKKLKRRAKTYQTLREETTYIEPEYYNPTQIFDPEGSSLVENPNEQSYRTNITEEDKKYTMYSDRALSQQQGDSVPILESFSKAAKNRKQKRELTSGVKLEGDFEGPVSSYQEHFHYHPPTELYDPSSSIMPEEPVGRTYMQSQAEVQGSSTSNAPLLQSFTLSTSRKKAGKYHEGSDQWESQRTDVMEGGFERRLIDDDKDLAVPLEMPQGLETMATTPERGTLEYIAVVSTVDYNQ